MGKHVKVFSMFKNLFHRGLVFLLIGALLAGCSATTTDEISGDDVEALSAVVQVSEAAQSLLAATATDSSSLVKETRINVASGLYPVRDDDANNLRFTIGAWNTPGDFPATPAALFEDDDFSDGTIARYPAASDEYIEDFYDIEGYRAYVELTESTDSWGDYQVNLYVYQTLSAEVKYTREQYRVPADDWTSLIDQTTNAYDPIAYEDIETIYFDDIKEERTVLWTRYVDGTVYTADYFAMPEDFDDAAYDYPAEITEPDTRTAVDDEGDALYEYAVHQDIEIENGESECGGSDDGSDDDSSDDDSSDDGSGDGNDDGDDDYCEESSAEEFYTELIEDDGLNRYSKTFINNAGLDGEYSADTQGVILYHIAGNLDKTVRAKSVETTTHSGDTRVRHTTEETVINDTDADDLRNYTHESVITTISDEIQDRHDEFTTSTTTLTLEEVDATDDSYTGTMTTDVDGDESAWTATLDFEDGLTLRRSRSGRSLRVEDSEDSAEEDVVTLSFGSLDHFSTEPQDMTITASFSGGTFSGTLAGDSITGTFTTTGGASYQVHIGGGVVTVE